MVLPRPSNTGILIGAVLVGALGMGANYFMQLAPETIASFMPHLPSFSSLADYPGHQVIQKPFDLLEDALPERSTKTDPQLPKPRMSLKSCIDELSNLEGNIQSVHQRWEKHGLLPPDYRDALEEICDRGLQLSRSIVDFPNAKERQKRTARLSALSISFFAAQMDPQKAGQVFDVISEEVLNASTNESDRARTAVLRFLVHHDLRQPNEDQLLEDLEAFGNEYDSPVNDIFLHKTIAKELSDRGLIEISNHVLQHGIRRYHGKGPVNRLINALIGQGGTVPH